jgi:hypothetical protein
MDQISSAEQLARRFHAVYERLAPAFGYETRTETRTFDPDTPNGRLMIEVCSELLGSPETGYAFAKRNRLAVTSEWMRGWDAFRARYFPESQDQPESADEALYDVALNAIDGSPDSADAGQPK